MTNILLITPEITKGMKSIGHKCLLSLRKNLTIIEYQVSQLQKIKDSKLTINIGFNAKEIQDSLKKHKNIDYFINHSYEDTNQSNNLISYIKEHKPSSLLIINSGIIIKNNIISKTFLKGCCKAFFLNKPKTNFNIGCLEQDKLEYLFYDMPQVWAEIFYLNEQAIDFLYKSDSSLFDQMYLFETINFLLQYNIQFEKVILNKSNIIKIQNIKDLKSVKTFYE